MKCPKCAYIGFEETDRCRNCGYEFALSDVHPVAPDMPMRFADDNGGPLADLELGGGGGPEPERRRMPAAMKPRMDLDRLIGVEPQTPDLPLFHDDADAHVDLPPLVSAPASPRRPLAVRRQTPQPARVRHSMHEMLDTSGTLDLPLPASAPREREPRPAPVDPGAGALAGSVRRVSAALLDVLLLGAVHAVTLYFTLRLCGLTSEDWRALPLPPLLAFFLIVDGAYLVAFTTAGGQTIGKMALGLKVVGDDENAVSAGTAARRALGVIASVLCLGAGLLPALVNKDRRALHDRLARTHVVRLPA
jgi:uncharacterized RDD family membrane protein YckC